MTKLSSTQKKLMEIVRSKVDSGMDFSIRDLQEEMGFASPRAISYHLEKLESAGCISRGHGGRVFKILSLQEAGPAVVFLPLLGNAPCGEPFIAEENYEKLLPVPLRLLNRVSQKDLYIIEAVGDSMAPKIENGDYIIFEAGEIADNGSVVIARTEEGVTVKKFYKTNDQIILKPINDKFQPLVFDKNKTENFYIDGVAVAVFKPEVNL